MPCVAQILVDEKAHVLCWNGLVLLRFAEASQLRAFWACFPDLRGASVHCDLRAVIGRGAHAPRAPRAAPPPARTPEPTASPKAPAPPRPLWPLAPLTPLTRVSSAGRVPIPRPSSEDALGPADGAALGAEALLGLLAPCDQLAAPHALRLEPPSAPWPTLLGADEEAPARAGGLQSQLGTPKLLSRRALSCELMSF